MSIIVNRVIIEGNGYAEPYRDKKHKDVIDYVAVRNDGWVMSYPEKFRSVALAMWGDSLVAEMKVDRTDGGRKGLQPSHIREDM